MTPVTRSLSDSVSRVLVPLDMDGHQILIEATSLESDDHPGNYEVDEKITRQDPLESVTALVKGVVSRVKPALDSSQPTKVSLEFGIEVQYDSGRLLAILLQGSSKANLKVCVEWSDKK